MPVLGENSTQSEQPVYGVPQVPSVSALHRLAPRVPRDLPDTLFNLYFNSEDAIQHTFVEYACDFPTNDTDNDALRVTMKELKTRFEEWLLAMKLPPHFVEEKLLSTIKDHCMCKVDGDTVKGMLFTDIRDSWVERYRADGNVMQLSCAFWPQFLWIYCWELQWYKSFVCCRQDHSNMDLKDRTLVVVYKSLMLMRFVLYALVILAAQICMHAAIVFGPLIGVYAAMTLLVSAALQVRKLKRNELP